MAKIRNWSKRLDVENGATHRWVHDEAGHEVTIEHGDGEWVMKLNGTEIRVADTRDEIYNKTIEWLREHTTFDDETDRLATRFAGASAD